VPQVHRCAARAGRVTASRAAHSRLFRHVRVRVCAAAAAAADLGSHKFADLIAKHIADGCTNARAHVCADAAPDGSADGRAHCGAIDNPVGVAHTPADKHADRRADDQAADHG
jgi:hypothetical protein